MPRNVRNWWVEGRADGGSSIGGRSISFGPQSSGGGINIKILARDHGDIVDSFHLQGYAFPDGSLRLTVFGPDGEVVAVHETRR